MQIPTAIDSKEIAKWWRTLPPREKYLALRVNQWGYRHRPAEWIQRFIDFGEDAPTDYQLSIARQLARNPSHRMAVRSLHGTGKTALAAWLVLWFFCTRDGFTDWKVITTAGSWVQLTHFLWPEIHKWARRIKWHLVGRPPLREKEELLTLQLKGSTGEAFAVSTNDVALIEGAHATHLMYLFDEAKAIPEDIWDGAEGAFSNADIPGFEGWAFAISTAGAPSGRFYDIFSKRDRFPEWWTYHITLEKAIRAGRVSRKWAEDRERNWGKNSAMYKNRVLGNFAKADETAVIQLEWVEEANRRWEEAVKHSLSDMTLTAVGVDVAWQGGDKSVITPLYDDYFVPEQREYQGEDPMAIVGRIITLPNLTKETPIVVDVIGIGAGVVARLRELGYNVIPFNAAEGTKLMDETNNFGFVNKRSAGWWALRDLLDPSKNPTLALPYDDELMADLTTPKWSVSSSGKIIVESKDQFRKRLGRSPDKGDSLVYAINYKIKRIGIV